jgi:hypothetical protein
MHPRISELLAYLDEERSGVVSALEAIPADARDVRPRRGEWSAAEVIEHLATVEKGTAKVISRSLAKAEAGGLRAENETSSVLDRLDRSDIRDETTRRDAPDIVRPLGALQASDALQALAISRAQLRSAVAVGDGLALGDVTVPHLALGDIDLYQWILFVGLHEGRHAQQLHRIAAQLAATHQISQ